MKVQTMDTLTVAHTPLTLWPGRMTILLAMALMTAFVSLYQVRPILQSVLQTLNEGSYDASSSMKAQGFFQSSAVGTRAAESRNFTRTEETSNRNADDSRRRSQEEFESGTNVTTERLPQEKKQEQSDQEQTDQGRSGSPSTTAERRPDEKDQEQDRTDQEQSATIKGPLNVVLLYADDWTFSTLGAMGNKYVKTPVLDQLAAEGVLFTHNCVTTSICMQSRATLYTGQYSSRHQTFYSYKKVNMYEEGRWNNTLYPMMLKKGYHVGFFGKFHHAGPPQNTFTHFESTHMSHYPRRGDGKTHVTQWNENDGVAFLENRPQEKPFFLTLSFFATHAEDGNPERYRPMNTSMHLYQDDGPVPVPKTLTEQHWKALPPFFNDRNFGRGRFRNRYDTPEVYQKMMKNMYRMATEVDTACGRILELLKKQGVENNTLVIFTTDNGNFHGEHGLAEKWYAYEESLRVPLIIKDPRMPMHMVGTKNSEFTLNIDLAPTILSAAGIDPPNVMQGRDMSPLYMNNHEKAIASWRKEFLYEFWFDIPDIPNSVALVGKGFKYIYWTDHNYTQFFDLGKDPLEEFDIFGSADKEMLMKAQLRLAELQISAKAGFPQ